MNTGPSSDHPGASRRRTGPFALTPQTAQGTGKPCYRAGSGPSVAKQIGIEGGLR
jgi:hypothetical protein